MFLFLDFMKAEVQHVNMTNCNLTYSDRVQSLLVSHQLNTASVL